MTSEYGGHGDFMEAVRAKAEERVTAAESALKEAFGKVITDERTEVIHFSMVTAEELAEAILRYPAALKPLLLVCNIAARAIERDLNVKNLDTYKPRLNEGSAKLVAEYLKRFLPSAVALPALCQLDRTAFVDKEIRKRKGRWEKSVLEVLSKISGRKFRKRMFTVQGQKFELDGACPQRGPIELAIDVKRIEARRDIHKRCDEIVNKARKFKERFPQGKIGAVIYYPFVEEHSNVRDRLDAPEIDSVVFAGERPDSIERAARLLLDKLEEQQR